MIFTGDIAVPDTRSACDLNHALEKLAQIFKGQPIIANLEGLVNEHDDHRQLQTPVLFNHPEAIKVLKKWNTVAVGLANNHTLDLPQQFDITSKILASNNIVFTGAGKSREAASAPVNFAEQGKDIWIFNYCWNFLFYHQSNPTEGVYLAEMNEEKIIKAVEQHKAKYPSCYMVMFFHWSFDLETLPFPMDRQFAQHLIDIGVNVVVGCHSHCVQGGEKYKDGFIVYGLGNFFLPHNIFANGKLSFPKWANLQLALEWNPVTNQAQCHWFNYEFNEGNHHLKFLATENFESSPTLKKYSPYQNLSTEEYLSFFKKNRRKKLLIPVFTDFRKRNSNAVKLRLLKSRARLARLMARLRLIQWQN